MADNKFIQKHNKWREKSIISHFIRGVCKHQLTDWITVLISLLLLVKGRVYLVRTSWFDTDIVYVKNMFITVLIQYYVRERQITASFQQQQQL